MKSEQGFLLVISLCWIVYIYVLSEILFREEKGLGLGVGAECGGGMN